MNAYRVTFERVVVAENPTEAIRKLDDAITTDNYAPEDVKVERILLPDSVS
uniref:Uncharacterized protein n=1 Tax=viral metagenome TaxID=1070528 RepID=A0A6M3JGP2_9ZZZZ